MKTTRCFLLTLLMVMTAMAAKAQTSVNQLIVPDITVQIGEAQLPVQIENTDEIVAIQFDLTLPDDIVAETLGVATNRCDDHLVTIRSVGDRTYRVVLYSPTNRPLRGQSGAVFQIPVTIPASCVEDTEYPMVISGVVLSKASGENVFTGATAGIIRIAKLPDLTVKNVTVADASPSGNSLTPGQNLVVSWQVENVGGVATGDGWSEQLLLVSADGAATRLLATTYCQDALEAGVTVSRQAEITLPELLGIDGEAYLQVKVIPHSNTGESTATLANNLSVSDALTVEKKLLLELSRTVVTEDGAPEVVVTVSRSGDWNSEQVFQLTAVGDDRLSADSRVTLPSTITLYAGYSASSVTVTVADNDVLDDNTGIIVTAQGNDYPEATARLTIEDNEQPDLELTASKTDVNEGETIQLTVTSSRVVTGSDLTVILSSENASRFSFPQTVTIAAGQSSATVDVTAIDDELPSLDLSNAFTASAAGYNKAELIVVLKDDDMPVLELTLQPTTVSEGAGLVAVAGILRRTTNTDSKITVKLTDDAEGRLFFGNRTLELASGVEEVSFNFGPIDNTTVDGDREYEIKAAVYVSSCSCSANSESAGTVTAKLTVLDNDGNSLDLKGDVTTLKEGDKTFVTVSRNTPTGEPLEVLLTSNADQLLSYNHRVTIPADAVSVKVEVTSLDNGTSGDTQVVEFTVAADGYASGACWMMITDQTLPDAVLSSLSLSGYQIEVDDSVVVETVISNKGAAPLMDKTRVNVYVKGIAEPIGVLYTPERLLPGDDVTLTKKVAVPNAVGRKLLYAVVNEGHEQQELVFSNNTSDGIVIDIQPKFTVQVSADKHVYTMGETVVLTGKATGTAAGNADVDIFASCDNVCHTLPAKTDADGNFRVKWTPEPGLMGHFLVAACSAGEKSAAVQDYLEIVGLKQRDTGYVTCEVVAGTVYKDTVTIVNPNKMVQHLSEVEVVQKPDGCDVDVQLPSLIDSYGTAKLCLAITGHQPSPGNTWEKILLRLVTDEGATHDLTLYYYCRRASACLVADVSSINATMTKGVARDYALTISNTGAGATGSITLSLPGFDWLSSVTPLVLPSLAIGESANVLLRFNPAEDTPLNVPYQGVIAVNCDNGDGLSLNFSVTAVSEEKGTLTVDVVDEYTCFTEEAPHVSGADVTVKHPATGVVVAEGKTGADGKITFELNEGYYILEVAESHHESYSNTVVINPGRDNQQQVYVGFNAISYSWEVVRDDVEDEYRIETVAKYETNVPKPVLLITLPKKRPQVNEMFPIVVTNKGLINAVSVDINLKVSDGYRVELVNRSVIDVLPPQQAHVYNAILRVDTTSTRFYPTIDPVVVDPDPTVIEPVVIDPDVIGPITPGPSDVSPNYNPGVVTPIGPGGVNPDVYDFDDEEDDEYDDSDPDKACLDMEVTVTDTLVCYTKGGLQIFVNTTTYGKCATESRGERIFMPITMWNPGGPGGLGMSTTNASGDIRIPEGGETPGICISEPDPCKHNVAMALGSKQCFLPLCIEPDLDLPCGVNLAGDCVLPRVNGTMDMDQALQCIKTGFECGNVPKWYEKMNKAAGKIGPWIKCGKRALDCMDDVYKACPQFWDNVGDKIKEKVGRSSRTTTRRREGSAAEQSDDTWDLFGEFMGIMEARTAEWTAVENYYTEFFGDEVWLDCSFVEFRDLLTMLASKESGHVFGTFDFEDCLPEHISQAQLQLFIERLNNSALKYSEAEYTGNANFIDFYAMNDHAVIVEEAENLATDWGFFSLEALAIDVNNRLHGYFEGRGSSVCSTVTLKFTQTMAMTREAFLGTLSVTNGHTSIPMEDVKLELDIRDEDGNVATSHEFEIHVEKLNGFVGTAELNSGWTLAAQSDGRANIRFIPTKYAAADKPCVYRFGGTLSYVDPYTGLEVRRILSSVPMTVNPSPELDLTYFMQRDVYGDDPLTLDVVEPMKAAEFALLINNKGNGDATNVRMVTQQPEIIENEKGAYIDFQLVSSQLNGGDAALSFGQSIANDFGIIPAHSQMYAQWWLTSTLLGHFTDYKVDATHVTSYGNPDLSLLDQVTIHELIHSLDLSTPERNMRGFLVNDIADAGDLPDRLYLTNGDVADVTQAAMASTQMTSSTTCLLTITPSAAGWNYGSVADPTHGFSTIRSIVRQSDGQEIGSVNFWQTDRTLLDGKDWLYENRLHFADQFAGTASETYVLTFDPVPQVVLAVESIDPIPEEGAIAEAPIDELKVKFSKVIDKTTFTADDITFAVQGVKQDATQIGISTEDDTTFTLDMSTINQTLSNGYYSLTVQTADIIDAEGFNGKSGKQVGWIMFRGGLVQLLTSAWPANSGLVARKAEGTASGARRTEPAADEANTARYGSSVTLVAEPAEGYEFASWTLNGKVVSTDEEFETTALGDMNVVANFKKKSYMVSVGVNGSGGTTAGTATGIYEHGTAVSVNAVPDEDYVLQGWTVNGEAAGGSGNSLTVTANGPLTIEAAFKQEYFRQTMTLAKGWNWVSGWLSEPLSLDGLKSRSNRIVGQTDELINDPEYGMVGSLTELTVGQAYKIQANMRFTNTFRGHLYDLSAAPITLHQGWNWIAWPSMEQASLTAIANAAEGDYIVSQKGFAEYSSNTWEGTLTELTPGEGYLYKSASDKALTVTSDVPAGARAAYRTASGAGDYAEQLNIMHRYPNTMNMTARIVRDGMELPGEAYNVYAFAGDEMRGVSQFVGSNHYLTVYGDQPVTISFVVESVETGDSYVAQETLTFTDDVVGSRKSPFVFTVGSTTGVDQRIDTSRPMTVYSLEGVLVSRDATLKTLRRLPKGVYIVNGHKCFVK